MFPSQRPASIVSLCLTFVFVSSARPIYFQSCFAFLGNTFPTVIAFPYPLAFPFLLFLHFNYTLESCPHSWFWFQSRTQPFFAFLCHLIQIWFLFFLICLSWIDTALIHVTRINQMQDSVRKPLLGPIWSPWWTPFVLGVKTPSLSRSVIWILCLEADPVLIPRVNGVVM